MADEISLPKRNSKPAKVPPVALSCVSSALSLTSNSPADQLPAIYNALTVDAETPSAKSSTILEVESQLPGDVVRSVAMTSTDGLQRGLEVVDTGSSDEDARWP